MASNIELLIKHASKILGTTDIDAMSTDEDEFISESVTYVILNGSYDYYTYTDYNDHITIPTDMYNFISHWKYFYNYKDEINFVVVCKNGDMGDIECIHLVSDKWEVNVVEKCIQCPTEHDQYIVYQWI